MKITKCKQTGLYKYQENHWIIRSVDDPNSWASLYLLGDDIFVGEWHGYITVELNSMSDIIFEEILNKYNLREKGYHYIIDNTDVKGTSLEVRSRYIPFLEKEIIYMKSHILVGLNPVLRFITNVGMRFSKSFLITKYHKNLETAISQLENSRINPSLNINEHNENNIKNSTSREKSNYSETDSLKETGSTSRENKIDIKDNKIWRYNNGEYNIYGEIIDNKIIYCRQEGYRTFEDLNVFFDINYQMLETLNNNDSILIEIIGNSINISDKKRKSIISFYLSLIGKISHLIFINPTLFQRATILMSKYLLRSKYSVHIVKTKGEAFELAFKIKKNNSIGEVITTDVEFTKSESIVKKRIGQLLNIVGRITWDPTFDYKYNEDFVGNDQFSILFETFEMLRKDIVSMKYDLENYSEKLEVEVQKATDKLKKQNIELEKAKNTAEQANKLKSAFLANMSHEIRTPMNAIVGLTNVLKENNISENDKKTYLELISKSNDHLLNIINDVVDISKIESNEMKISPHTFNLNELLKDILDSQKLALKSNVKANLIEINLKTEVDDNNFEIEADSTRLKQVLLNLINNAIKFTPEGEITFGYKIIDNKLHFFVKDTGIGISDEKIISIFERFIQAEVNTTRKYGGTGLGLSISKSLVELWGGNIFVNSTLNVGTEFGFTLPLVQPKKLLTKSSNTDANVDLENLKILIAEDDNINYLVLKAMLTPFKCKLKRVVNGREAIDEITNNKDYDLILMDIQMPEIDGIEATKQIIDLTKNIPIIAQTADAFEDEKKIIFDVGCVDYIVKPIKKDILIKSIRKNVIKRNL